MRNNGRNAGGGFTLLEMLVVLVILGLALGLVLARGPAASPAASLASATARVEAALRLARSQAIAGNRDVTVTLDPQQRTLRTGTRPPARLPEGTRVAAGKLVTVRFAPDGTAAGGPVVLAAGGFKRVISVNWLTGRVEEGDGAASER